MERIKKFINDMNSKGVPIPMIRYKGVASGSFTMVVLSFNLTVFGIIGKMAKILGTVDMTNALTLFGICCGLHFGRGFQKDGNKVTVDDGQNKE